MNELGVLLLAIIWFIPGVLMVVAPQEWIDFSDAFTPRWLRIPEFRNPALIRKLGCVVLAVCCILAIVHFAFGI